VTSAHLCIAVVERAEPLLARLDASMLPEDADGPGARTPTTRWLHSVPCRRRGPPTALPFPPLRFLGRSGLPALPREALPPERLHRHLDWASLTSIGETCRSARRPTGSGDRHATLRAGGRASPDSGIGQGHAPARDGVVALRPRHRPEPPCPALGAPRARPRRRPKHGRSETCSHRGASTGHEPRDETRPRCRESQSVGGCHRFASHCARRAARRVSTARRVRPSAQIRSLAPKRRRGPSCADRFPAWTDSSSHAPTTTPRTTCTSRSQPRSPWLTPLKCAGRLEPCAPCRRCRAERFLVPPISRSCTTSLSAQPERGFPP
jgi:hypothetical protein